MQDHDHSKPDTWTVLPTRSIETLRDAVVGAGLNAVQMSKGPLGGSLAFAEKRGVTFTSGSMGGRVALSGPLSSRQITFGLGLHVSSGTWHWQRELRKGCIGVFHPGDEHDSLYTAGSLYLTASLDLESLDQCAEEFGLVVDKATLGRTGFHDHLFDARWIDAMAARMRKIHAGEVSADSALHNQMMRAALTAYSRAPRPYAGRESERRHARVFSLARDFIHAHLGASLTVEDIARAAATTPRTLNRVFLRFVGDTPYNFVQMLRLNVVRRELLTRKASELPIHTVATNWGLREAGRFSGLYRETFGELPSDTRKSANGLRQQR